MKPHTFGMSAARRLWRTGPGLVLAVLLCCPVARAENKKQETAPDIASRKELWVPSSQWQTILKKHPQAVMLTSEQYEALVRDAGKVQPPKPELPLQALVESLHFKGSAADGTSDVLRLEGEMNLRCLTDDWTEVTARLPFRDLASVTVDGSEVMPPAAKGNKNGKASLDGTTRRLLVHGKGSHRITLQALVPITSTGLSATRHLAFQGTDVAGMLDLQLPPGAVVISGSLPYTREADTLHVLLQAAGTSRDIAWSSGSGLGEEARQLHAEAAASVTDRSIESIWKLELERAATSADSTLAFEVIPASAIVVSLEGEGISHWEQKQGRLEATLSGRSQHTLLHAHISSVVDLQGGPAAQALDLPALRFQGHISRDVEARIARLAEGVTLMEYQGASPSAAGLLVWNPVRTSVKLLLRKADPRLIVDADARIFVSRDDVTINRTLAVQTDRPVNELRVTLPQGEEFLAASSTKGASAEWKRVGQTVQYTWLSSLAGGQSSTLQLQSRKRLPATPEAAAGHTVTVEAPVIADAKKLAGYVAVDFDPAWRLAVLKATGLEERDARVTPVQGKMAWFSLRSYSLSFDLHRRDPVFDASITAYALPRARAIEIEGQITLDVVDAPLRQFKVAIAKESAGLVRFTSPLVGEQTLDAATGQWSLSLRKESLGRIPVRFRLSLPASTEGQPKAQEEVIKALLPSIAVPSVRRQRGVWVVEANTDTELSFDAKAMQPLDVLRAPAIEDYQPRHRVVAAFEYAAPEASLTLHAARHGHSELAALIVSQMELTSVLSTDGSVRHQVVLRLSHSGEQYVNVALPAGSQVLSALAAGDPVKPVRGPGGAISIPLPAGSADQPSLEVGLLYETTGSSWTASGSRHLQPPTIPGHVSILATDWRVYVPDGYSFKKVKTDLAQEGTGSVVRPQAFFLPGGATAKHLADDSVDIVVGQIQAQATGKPILELEGQSYLDLGDFDNARKGYEEILRTDPYNVAARRGLEEVEKRKKVYFSSARDHQRSRMLAQVDGVWKDSSRLSASDAIVYRMRTVRLPSVKFDNATMSDAIHFLNSALNTYDRGAGSGRIPNIVLKGDAASSRITLDLKDVPMEEALRYVTELAGMKYKITPQAVEIWPLTESATEMITRTFQVPPDFLLSQPDTAGAPGNAPKLMQKKSAKEILVEAGVPFPEGSSATYDPVTGRLVVRNTSSNIDLIEAFDESVHTKRSPAAAFQEGLLPLELELPQAGRQLRFYGPLAPSELTLNYASTDRQVLRSWLLILAGSLLFAALGRRRPLLATLLVLLLLCHGISLISEEWQPLANAVLLGWIVALALGIAWSLLKMFEPRRMEGGQA